MEIEKPPETHGGADTHIALRSDAGEASGWQRGSVLGLYLHGLFESSAVPRAWFGHAPRTLDTVLDGLADFIDRHFEPGAPTRLASSPTPITHL